MVVLKPEYSPMLGNADVEADSFFWPSNGDLVFHKRNSDGQPVAHFARAAVAYVVKADGNTTTGSN